ncbi:MAG TPA: hypothetical protein VIC26_09695 [Marinagarivorans sp.]
MKWFAMAVVLASLVGCNGQTIIPDSDGDNANAQQAERIELNQTRVFGGLNADYSRYSLRVFDTRDGWDQFVGDYASGDLAKKLSAAQADFDTQHLIAYVFNENSGSIEVSPLPPQIDGNALHFNITRFVPNMGTDDIATYLLVYRVSQSFESLYFDNGTYNLKFPNAAGEYTEALNCETFAHCNDAPQAPLVQEIDTPFREHGYSNFNTVILGSQNELDNFTKTQLGEDSWNDKQSFVSSLLDANTDFDEYNLLIYRLTETSGSNEVQLLAPSVEGGIATILVSRSVPEVGTADMAYYAAAYQVHKSLQEIRFEGGKHDEFFGNTPGENVAPLNCTAWFDGCNTCSRDEGGLVTCTLKFCQQHEALKCNTWAE